MEKIFDIISSYIPEEQQADVKAKIDGELGLVIKESSTLLKKELSGKYGVNFFEEDVQKAFDNKAFVKREVFESELNKYKELETNFNTLKEESEKNGNYKVELEKYKTYNEASIKLVKEGLNPDRIEAVQPLLNGEGEVDERVAKVKEQFPELFQKETTFSNTNPTKEKKKILTGAEEYFSSKKK